MRASRRSQHRPHRSFVGPDSLRRMLADVVRKATKGSRVEPPSATTIAFLRKHHVPPKAIQVLKASSVSAPIRVGRLTLYPFSALPKQNGRPNQHALRNGFLVIGNGLNGDPIAVELSNGEVAFLAHDILWGLDPNALPSRSAWPARRSTSIRSGHVRSSRMIFRWTSTRRAADSDRPPTTRATRPSISTARSGATTRTSRRRTPTLQQPASSRQSSHMDTTRR